MDPIVFDWLSLIVRWIHVITGIAWIGSSFYFMWLDAHLAKPNPPRDRIEGEIWMVHSGGFYLTEKRKLVPGEVPPDLHWFKWEAAFTLITGLLLLVLVYYLSAEVYLIDRSVADIGPATAIGIGVATLVVGWLIYDLLWISPLAARYEPAATVLSCLLLAGAAYGLTQVFGGRGAFIHVGALIGTIMVVNVWVRILPAQSAMIAATEAGREADYSRGLKAKQRSVHNNYMTLPVLFIMISNHYPMTYGHPYNWAILLALFAVGAGVRHYFNLRNRGVRNRWLIPAAAAATVALAVATAPRVDDDAIAEADDGEPVTFAQAHATIRFHCTSCHSANPTHETFDKAPNGVVFDTPADIQQRAGRILARTVVTKTMPLGNETEMSDEERLLLGRWIYQGAKIDGE